MASAASQAALHESVRLLGRDLCGLGTLVRYDQILSVNNPPSGHTGAPATVALASTVSAASASLPSTSVAVSTAAAVLRRLPQRQRQWCHPTAKEFTMNCS
eukprot:GHVU01226542.1.p2 GENE.GHVU01226542.1~~GHVU01226542.1.p2  ORF type:complete len:101 (-),score=2.55 GHVU01226542.1:226-528(-)